MDPSIPSREAMPRAARSGEPQGLLPSYIMFKDLSSADRLRLMKFVCSFAWADLEIRPEERAFVGRLVSGLALDSDEQVQVQRWLERPPSPESLDPARIPAAHRRLFVEAAEGVIAADGRITPEESENLAVFKRLLA